MANRLKKDESGDNEELQALFDSMAGKPVAAPAPVAPPDPSGDSPELENLFEQVVASSHTTVSTAAPADTPGDNPELQNLFDSVAADAAGTGAAAGADSAEARQERMFNKLGTLTRHLHDALRELGYDRKIEETARQIPDARQRLSYIAQMTEQAASRVLNATDVAKPIQDRVEEHATVLNQRWERLYGRQLSVEEFKCLAGDTRGFLEQVTRDSKVVNEQLLEIMMAQDFQDLTGQVIKKVVDMAAVLEQELLGLLLEVVPDNRKPAVSVQVPVSEGLLNGPVINAAGRDDVVTNQEQVDDLLESLGF